MNDLKNKHIKDGSILIAKNSTFISKTFTEGKIYIADNNRFSRKNNSLIGVRSDDSGKSNAWLKNLFEVLEPTEYSKYLYET